MRENCHKLGSNLPDPTGFWGPLPGGPGGPGACVTGVSTLVGDSHAHVEDTQGLVINEPGGQGSNKGNPRFSFKNHEPTWTRVKNRESTDCFSILNIVVRIWCVSTENIYFI